MSTRHTLRWHVGCDRHVGYDILVVSDLFHPANPTLASVGRVRGGRRFVVIDHCVARFHAATITRYFSHHGITAHLVTCHGGEAHKTMTAYQTLLRRLDSFPIHRRDEPIIVIGGGVLCDVVGFVASTYRRGVPHVKVPTTLMGYVDAAVGVKTGINFNGHKNRVGSFEPPRCVLLDKSLLTTLSRRHLRNGMCEIIKLAVIRDAPLFSLLEDRGATCLKTGFQDPAGDEILHRAVSVMVKELSSNLFEDELRRAVDFGHTFSYGFETEHGDHLLHGEAVILDVVLSTQIATRRGLLSAEESERIFQLLKRLGITPAVDLLHSERLWRSLQERVEHRNGPQHVPLPAGLGRCFFVEDITLPEIKAAVNALREREDVSVTHTHSRRSAHARRGRGEHGPRTIHEDPAGSKRGTRMSSGGTSGQLPYTFPDRGRGP